MVLKQQDAQLKRDKETPEQSAPLFVVVLLPSLLFSSPLLIASPLPLIITSGFPDNVTDP